MKISELDRVRLKKWAEERIPAHAKAEIAVGCVVRGSAAVITEERAPWDGVGQWTSRRVARLRRTDAGWQVDGAGRNGRWYPCDHLPAVSSLDEALAVLDDPRHALWG
ncbi:DUF3024 domain-containing protein [Streptomyces sp. NPDC005507]|uniref:DUF3024 domain-containing protein n=1 Tax=Streptomyces sp. NPDC005507 TaxID=3154885 RepID=UPI0033A8404D